MDGHPGGRDSRADGQPDGRGAAGGRAGGTSTGVLHVNAMTEQAYRAMEEEFSILIRRARARALEVAREVHPELDGDAYGLLAALDRSGSSRVTDLAASIGVGKGTMSRQVRALEDLGLVQRTADPADGRAFLLELTPDGRRRYRAARDARRARLRQELSAWSEQDVRQLAELLHRFNARTS